MTQPLSPGGTVYKGLAPPEPEHHLVVVSVTQASLLAQFSEGYDSLTTTLELKSLRKIIWQISFIVRAA
jgi:hypothetical protein